MQNKACRYFLRGGKCASNVDLRGDLGYNSYLICESKKLKCSDYGLRSIPKGIERLLKSVHNWSKRYARGWEGRVTKLSNQLNVTNIIHDEALPIRFALKVSFHFHATLIQLKTFFAQRHVYSFSINIVMEIPLLTLLFRRKKRKIP